MTENTCPHHEKTRELIADLTTRVALAEQAAEVAQKEMNTMGNQMRELMVVTQATQRSVNQWGWSFYVTTVAFGLIYQFRDPLSRLLGWL